MLSTHAGTKSGSVQPTPSKPRLPSARARARDQPRRERRPHRARARARAASAARALGERARAGRPRAPKVRYVRVDHFAVLAADILGRSRRRRISRGGHGAEGLLGERDELVMLDARRGKHHVGRRVVRLHEAAEHVGREVCELLLGAEQRHAERRARIACGMDLLGDELQRVVRHLGQVARVEGLLLRELPLGEARLERRLREDLDDLLCARLEAAHSVHHLLAARVARDLRAEALDLAHHAEGRARRRALRARSGAAGARCAHGRNRVSDGRAGTRRQIAASPSKLASGVHPTVQAQCARALGTARLAGAQSAAPRLSGARAEPTPSVSPIGRRSGCAQRSGDGSAAAAHPKGQKLQHVRGA